MLFHRLRCFSLKSRKLELSTRPIQGHPSRHSLEQPFKRLKYLGKRLGASLILTGSCLGLNAPALAVVGETPETLTAQSNGLGVTLADLDEFCRLPERAVARKASLREQSQTSPDQTAPYQQVLNESAQVLQACRQRTWPRKQAMWLRLYPCDLRGDYLEETLDTIVNAGYNQVFIEVFYDGRVLLPTANNPTPWPSVINAPGYEQADLLAQALDAARARGLEAHAWLFTMNFGYSYSQRSDRAEAIAHNGRQLNSLNLIDGEIQVFIDPYNPQAQRDYAQLVELVLRRRPDGILFDYVRYPRGTGSNSVVSQVQDLLIYSPAAQAALVDRALNQKGRDLIQRFLRQGYVSVGDIAQVNQLYPQEGEPQWQGRTVPPTPPQATPTPLTPEQRQRQQEQLQRELWLLSVAHAQRGILDFVGMGITLAQQRQLASGTVFFPGGNQTIGQWGFDSRLQPWDRFPVSSDRHPMSYSTCGQVDCIVAEIQRVLDQTPNQTNVQPALAGIWNYDSPDRPSLEKQMQAIRQRLPRIQAVSHFAYSWQYPQSDQERKFCHL